MDTKLITKTCKDKIFQLQAAFLKTASHLDIACFQESLFFNVSDNSNKYCYQYFVSSIKLHLLT